MRATVDAKAFYEALKTVSGAIRRSQVPALEQIRVDFLGGICRLTASDLTVWLIKEIPAEGDSFSFMFSDTPSVVRASRYFDGEMSVELRGEKDDMKVLFFAGGKTGEFSSEDANMSPVCPSEEARYSYSLDAPVLLERVGKVRYAAIVNPSKPELAGVRFDGIHIWCVDGHRMAVNDDPGLNVERQFILPCNALMQLKAFPAGKTELMVGERYAAFSMPGLRLVIRQLLASDALHADTVIPSESRETFSIERKQMLDAIRYLDGCSRRKRIHSAVFSGDKLTMENGGCEYSAALNLSRNSSIKFAFDVTQMKEALEQQLYAEKAIHISIISDHNPIVLRSGLADTALIMPVRIRDEWRRNAA